MTAAARGRRAGAGALVGAALVLITINLRLAISAVPPVLDDIRDTLGMTTTTAGILTTLPVLCFGLAAPLAPWLARRFGQEVILLACLGAVVAGIAIRLAPSIAPLFLGTIVLGVGIAVANVLMPSVIKRRFADPGLMMGLFTMSLSVSGALGTAFTVPLEGWFGGWRWALAFWALPALVAIAVWAPDVRRSGAQVSAGSAEAVSLGRDRVAWLVTGAFGLQSLLFYAYLSWVPDILRDAGLSSGRAGALLSLSLLMGIPTSLALPVVAGRMRDQRPLALIAPVMWAAGLAGLLADPGGPTWVWMVLAGIGQGTGISFALTMIVLRSPDGVRAAALSGMAQGVGYLLAAVGPFAVGALHDLTGGWKVPLAGLLVVTGAMLACAVGAGADRSVEGRDPTPPGGGSSPARV